AVRKENISSLVIDLTHNGGGSDWVEDITALLTNEKLVCGRGGFVKHPHHAKNFKELLADFEANSPNDKAKIANMKANIKVASESCDRTPIWTKKGHQLNCSLVGYPKGEKCKYDGELKYPGKKKYSGKLFLLTNRHTASAAEDIVARHLDSKTATIIGGRTYGAGCGYMNGGIRFQLPNSGLDVRVPDCVREMADGTNEVVGIEPNVKMDMEALKEKGFLSKLIKKVAEK
ncbi:MAG: hypothetical protein HRT44_12270, partial [Bdellovibrionales bacterium]|nr:S41 family peptidase [Bdellovibrionales bacterium]NQZ20014.1 hypothetical protein [Bdellovibrionales bacterium]